VQGWQHSFQQRLVPPVHRDTHMHKKKGDVSVDKKYEGTGGSGAPLLGGIWSSAFNSGGVWECFCRQRGSSEHKDGAAA